MDEVESLGATEQSTYPTPVHELRSLVSCSDVCADPAPNQKATLDDTLQSTLITDNRSCSKGRLWRQSCDVRDSRDEGSGDRDLLINPAHYVSEGWRFVNLSPDLLYVNGTCSIHEAWSVCGEAEYTVVEYNEKSVCGEAEYSKVSRYKEMASWGLSKVVWLRPSLPSR